MLQPFRSRRAFTLIEVFLIVAIVAMMIAIIIPGAMQSRRRGRAEAVRLEMKLLDRALQQYATATGKKAGATATFKDVKKYLPPGSHLVQTGGSDLLGHPFGTLTVDSPVLVPPKTAAQLDAVVDPAFWADYK